MRAAFIRGGGNDDFYDEFVRWRREQPIGLHHCDLPQLTSLLEITNVQMTKRDIFPQPPPPKPHDPISTVTMEKDRYFQELCPLVQFLIQLQSHFAAEVDTHAALAKPAIVDLAKEEDISSPVARHSCRQDI